MGGAFSFLYQKSTSTSEQTALSTIAQQFSGTCNIACDNNLNNVNIIVTNSEGENITLSQSCTANGQCNFNNNMNALSDVYFQAGNEAAALPGGLNFGNISYSVSDTDSRQYISQNIFDQATEACNVSSTNNMNNIFIAASNDDYGNITILQNGNVAGSCALNNLMSATTEATSIANNCSTAGGKGYKACSGKGVSWGYIILYIVIGLVAVIALSVIARIVLTKNSNTSSSSEGASNINTAGINTADIAKLAEVAG